MAAVNRDRSLIVMIDDGRAMSPERDDGDTVEARQDLVSEFRRPGSTGVLLRRIVPQSDEPGRRGGNLRRPRDRSAGPRVTSIDGVPLRPPGDTQCRDCSTAGI